MKILACNSNPVLAKRIDEWLQLEPIKANIGRFNDGEIFVEIKENVRGEDVFVIQTTSSPENVLELLIVVDALRRSSVQRIVAVIPYFGYARQDRKAAPRTPISAKLIANLLTVAGVQRVLTVDLHADQIQGFFDIPLDHLITTPLFQLDIKKRFEKEKHFKKEDILIVSSDVGGVKRARDLANRLHVGLAIIDKRREKPGSSEVMHIIGEVGHKHCILLDDIIDSGGSLCNAVHALLQNNVQSVHAYCTHAVFSGHALEKVTCSGLESLVITDSILPHKNFSQQNNIRILSIAPLLAEAMKRIFGSDSVSDLFSAESLEKVLNERNDNEIIYYNRSQI